MKKIKIKPMSRLTKSAVKLIFISAVIGLATVLLLGYKLYIPTLQESTRTLYVTSANEVVEELNSSFDSINDYIYYISESSLFKKGIEEYNSEENRDEISKELNNFLNITDSIRAVYATMADGTIISSDYLAEDADRAYINRVNEHKYNRDYCFYYTESGIPTAAVSIKRNDCLIIVLYDAQKLAYTLKIHADTYFSGMALYGTNSNNIVMCSYGDISGCDDILKENLNSEEESSFIKQNNGYYLINRVKSIGWTVVSFIDYETFNKNVLPPFYTAISLCVLLGLMMVIITGILINRLIKPIGSLKESMLEASSGNLNVRAEIHSQDEIGDLSDSFNKMIHDLNINISKRIESEEREQRLKYNLLASQINHHFIHNTISIVNAFIRHNMMKEALLANKSLAKILRSCLKIRDIDMFNSVSDEMELVNAYWDIEKLRKTNHAVLSYKISEEAYDRQIPKNLLQPLIENSLIHGLTDHESGECIGEIIVSAEVEEDKFVLTVEDDGIGFSKQALERFYDETGEESSSGKHVSLSNIRKRLRFVYDCDCMDIKTGETTQIIITIPK